MAIQKLASSPSLTENALLPSRAFGGLHGKGMVCGISGNLPVSLYFVHNPVGLNLHRPGLRDSGMAGFG